jgi:hypothetical protein
VSARTTSQARESRDGQSRDKEIAEQIRVRCDYWPKPVPSPRYDWVAFEDGQEEACIYGYGATQLDAIADLFREIEFRAS